MQKVVRGHVARAPGGPPVQKDRSLDEVYAKRNERSRQILASLKEWYDVCQHRRYHEFRTPDTDYVALRILCNIIGYSKLTSIENKIPLKDQSGPAAQKAKEDNLSAQQEEKGNANLLAKRYWRQLPRAKASSPVCIELDD